MKTLRTPLVALLGLALAVALVGSSCSSANPVALQVGDWQLSNSTLEEQMESFASAYAAATSQEQADSSLRSQDGKSWSTTFTAQFLNDQLNLQLAQLAVANKGLEVTDDDRATARQQLEQNYTGNNGQSVFDQLTQEYQDSLIEGVAAQTVLQGSLTTDDALRSVFEADDTFKQPVVCASHILILAGQPDGQTTPSDADYATALAGIEAVQKEITGPEDFAAVATAKSQDTGSAPDGGDLGCAPQGTYVTEFDDAAWSQPIGVVGQPVKTIYGYHLILVRSRGVPTFEDVKAQIAAQVKSNPDTVLAPVFADLAKQTTISVDGRWGQFDEDTAKIVAPAGAEQPSTTTTAAVDPLAGAATP